jgi:DNA-binding response OmpR family regulator
LRNLLGKPDLPVILLTEGRDGTETLYSAESVATDYLARPFSPPDAPHASTRVAGANDRHQWNTD